MEVRRLRWLMGAPTNRLSLNGLPLREDIRARAGARLGSSPGKPLIHRPRGRSRHHRCRRRPINRTNQGWPRHPNLNPPVPWQTKTGALKDRCKTKGGPCFQVRRGGDEEAANRCSTLVVHWLKGRGTAAADKRGNSRIRGRGG